MSCGKWQLQHADKDSMRQWRRPWSLIGGSLSKRSYW